MKPQNIEDIRKRTLHFTLLFIVLISFSIVPVYFFFWAAGQQKKAFLERLQDYKQVQNKQLLLKDKIDSLYIQLNYVNAEKVNNYLALENGILENKYATEVSVGKDSLGNFKAYAMLLKKLTPQLYMKDSILKMASVENTIKTDLRSCMDQTQKIHRDIFTQTQSSSK
ncbi:MAG: type VI secretion system TssO [Chitinophagaceae bacterium]